MPLKRSNFMRVWYHCWSKKTLTINVPLSEPEHKDSVKLNKRFNLEIS